MHRYLKAIGFDNIRTRNDLKSILADVQDGFNHQTIVSYRPGEDFCEIRKDYGQCMGISLCGEMDENDMHQNLDNCYRNWTRPCDAVRLIDLFLEGKAVSGEYYDFIKRTMTECTTGTARLPYPLKDTDAVIGHKTGTGDKNSQGRYIGINDIGFIDLPNGSRYLIAVFVKDSAEDYETTERVIAEISSVVYNSINNQ